VKCKTRYAQFNYFSLVVWCFAECEPTIKGAVAVLCSRALDVYSSPNIAILSVTLRLRWYLQDKNKNSNLILIFNGTQRQSEHYARPKRHKNNDIMRCCRL
jgi:hypothetical protein